MRVDMLPYGACTRHDQRAFHQRFRFQSNFSTLALNCRAVTAREHAGHYDHIEPAETAFGVAHRDR